MRAFICLLVLAASVASNATAEDIQYDEDASEAASLMQAFQANLESLGVIDVCIETTRFRHEEGMRAFEESIVRERLVLDESQGIGVFATVYEVKRSQPEMKSEPLITKVVVSHRKGDRAGQRAFPEQVRWFDIDGEQTFGTIANHPDFRFIGRYAYPMPAGSFSTAVTESLLKAGLAANPGTVVQTLPGQNALVSHRYIKDPTQVRITQKTYDLKTNLLVSMRVSRHVKEPAEEIPQMLERYQWSEAGDVYVPSEIEGEQRKLGKGPDGKPLVWIEQYNASFRWLAVNSEVNTDKISSDLFTDLNAVLKFVKAEGETDIATPLR